MKISLKPKMRGRTVAFLTIVPLLVATSLAKVDCPVCGGQGSVISFPSMENVRITRVESEVGQIRRDACGIYLMYNYNIKLSIDNSGAETATGWIKLVLIDFKDGRPLDSQYTVVEIPGRMSLDVEYNVWFRSGRDDAARTEVAAEVLLGSAPDKACNGTEKVALNSWPLASSFKDRFKELGRAEKPFAPPIQPYNPEGHLGY